MLLFRMLNEAILVGVVRPRMDCAVAYLILVIGLIAAFVGLCRQNNRGIRCGPHCLVKAVFIACQRHHFVEERKFLFLSEVENKLFPSWKALETTNKECGQLIGGKVVALMCRAIGDDLFVAQFGEPVAIRVDIVVALTNGEARNLQEQVVALYKAFGFMLRDNGFPELSGIVNGLVLCLVCRAKGRHDVGQSLVIVVIPLVELFTLGGRPLPSAFGEAPKLLRLEVYAKIDFPGKKVFWGVEDSKASLTIKSRHFEKCWTKGSTVWLVLCG